MLKLAKRHIQNELSVGTHKDCSRFYIDGKWVDPTKAHGFQVINPASEEAIATISLGSATEVDNAIAAAKRAFESYSQTTVHTR